MDFIVLRMTGGRLVLSADLGRGPASCTSSSTVNDGEAHLDVEDRLFLGGLPHKHSTRRINCVMVIRWALMCPWPSSFEQANQKPCCWDQQRQVDAIGLELIHGQECVCPQVVFNVNNGGGRVSVRSIGPLLCDGLWHHRGEEDQTQPESER
ncbi:hypothetical protein F7725_014823 [Dissostichus mawsoni]|uniref:Uncharacterized protein n=1 Tax=Dissostichus mawsoni TaxID=36200 RepID=A0A7J5YFS6_DISMA|nr:hypothetical protein F7725_014823 [Dissostichus mawsoni]